MAGQVSIPLTANANLWVLDFLLESDGLDDTLIKHFHDVNQTQFEELPPNTQARLMLRVLRDAPSQLTGVAEAALGALNMLKNLADQLAETYGPNFSTDLRPSEDLFLDVKTELVLKNLRIEDAPEHPRAVMDRFFVPNEQTGMLTPGEMGRRNEIVEGLKGQEEIRNLLNRHPIEKLNESLLTFVATARHALGPNMLKIVEKDVAEGRYHPHVVPYQGNKRRRKTSTAFDEDAERAMTNLSHSTTALAGSGGNDPLGEGGTIGQHRDQMETAVDGTRMMPSATDAQALRGKQIGQAARRRNGRWSEEETNLLIRSVRLRGKGKWKRILEEGATVFQNRSQVDLKDKWRNLERQGIVGPQDLPAAAVPQLSGQIQLGIPQNLGHAQVGPDGQLLSAGILTGNQDLGDSQAQQYNLLAQYAAQLGQQQAQAQAQHLQMTPEMLQQQLAQVSQLPGQGLQQLPSHILHLSEQQIHQHQDLHHQNHQVQMESHQQVGHAQGQDQQEHMHNADREDQHLHTQGNQLQETTALHPQEGPSPHDQDIPQEQITVAQTQHTGQQMQADAADFPLSDQQLIKQEANRDPSQHPVVGLEGRVDLAGDSMDKP